MYVYDYYHNYKYHLDFLADESTSQVRRQITNNVSKKIPNSRKIHD